jgi:hypothetical protein
MSKENYKRFRKGLKAGITALWRPDFMSGVRNGGFEQTLRNVCIPFIEKATGRMAFTESHGRADLLLCGDEAATCTRCEFKINFALQHGEIYLRKQKAIDQVRKPTDYETQDGIVVYAIAELIRPDHGLSGNAKRHNDHVASTPYKLFQIREISAKAMKIARRWQETENDGDLGVAPAFDPLFGSNGVSLEWEANLARLHVWTYHVTTEMP